MIRIFNQFPIDVQQPEVNAPAIDADTPDLSARRFCRLAYPRFNFAKQFVEIPPQRPALFNWAVTETMDFFESNFIVRDRAEHHSAALGTEVNRDIFFHFRHRQFLLHSFLFYPVNPVEIVVEIAVYGKKRKIQNSVSPRL
ncbi:hypothetical protein ES703_17210 [subsurface metagenome]